MDKEDLEPGHITTSNGKPKESAEVLVRKMAHQKVRVAMQKMQVEILEEIDERLTVLVTEVMKEVELTEISSQLQHFDESTKYTNRKKSDKPGSLPDKQFLARNSLLTDLFEIKHIRTIYNIFIVILIILFMNSVVDDIVAGNSLKLSVGFIRWSFGEFRMACAIWTLMIASTFSLYVCFSLWANQLAKLAPKSVSRMAWNYLWLALLIAYQTAFLYVPVAFVMGGKLPPASAFTVLCEQVRLIMKSHAFVRSNAPRALSFKPHDEKHEKHSSPCPGFSHFLYFLFCPTLVYRDQYPRTKSIRWKIVVWNFMEVIGVIFYMSFIFERFLVPSYKDFGLKPTSHEDRIVLVFGSILPGMLSFLCGFYCLLHSWLNAFAEMMKFADKMFYQDWWNANSYGAYYRRWNVVVHDWLYTYVYKDVASAFRQGQRLPPTMAVFAVSAGVHEYILAFTFGFFYPMLMITFGFFGMALVFITSDKAKGGNVFMWLCLSIGTGLLTSLYCMEWYARINCAPAHDSILDFFVPRSWNCMPGKTF